LENLSDAKMGAHKPRSGSLAFYPRGKAARETPSFSTFPDVEGTVRPLNFLGYKVGMIHGIGRNEHQKSVSYGQMIYVPCTVIECPPIKIIGVRVYGKGLGYGTDVIAEATIEKPDKHLRKKFRNFKQLSSKKKKERKEKAYTTIDDLEKMKGKAVTEGGFSPTFSQKVEGEARFSPTFSQKVVDVKLLCQAQPSLTDFGKKNPDIFEISLNGNVDGKFSFAREKFGKDLKVSDVFQEKQFIDVKAVDKGKGMQGVIKRFGVKIQRPKAKTQRIVGSISPWKPSTVMWTVARPGQMGYQTRTELNKRILRISNDLSKVNVPEGYIHYGNVKNDYVLLAGSVPGPVKRAIGMRFAVRKAANDSFNIAELVLVGTKGKEKIEVHESKAEKVVAKKEEKKQHSSVEDEIKAATAAKK